LSHPKEGAPTGSESRQELGYFPDDLTHVVARDDVHLSVELD
jgi:hypothetical protein